MVPQAVIESVAHLWPTQARGIEAVLSAIDAGERRILLTSPTGGGKTRIASELIRHWRDSGHRVVLYTNRRLLVEQLSGVLADHGHEHGVRAAGYDDELHLPIQVSSVQTEHARVLRRGTWKLHDADRVLIDEAHIQKGDVARKLLEAHLAQGAAYVGLTATPLDMGSLYDVLLTAGTKVELRACGALVPCHHYGPDEPDTRHIRRQKTGEYAEKDVRKVIMTSTIWARVFDWWKRLNPDARPTILFAPGVGESIWFAEQFTARGIPAAHIDGDECWFAGKSYRSDRAARAAILDDSREGRVKVVCNRFVLREGVDAPWLYHGIFATVYGSLGSYLQSGGRLLRADPSLDHVVLQDHGGNWWRHGSLNADRRWELGQTEHLTTGLREERMRAKKEAEPIVCPQCASVRTSGPTCPRCGFEAHRKSRIVVQKDGSLKEYHGDIFRPRRTALKPNTHQIWERVYHRMKRAKRTFRQAEALFYHENLYWPPRDLPYMPTRDVDWFRGVHEVPAERLSNASEDCS